MQIINGQSTHYVRPSNPSLLTNLLISQFFHFCIKNRQSKFLQNADNHLPYYMMYKPGDKYLHILFHKNLNSLWLY
jgi:hypothetical protein